MQITEVISQGTILIRGDALLPRLMQPESDPYWKGWRRIPSPQHGALAKQVREAGWNFFFLAGEIKASTFGSGETALRRAVERILGGLKRDPFNCLEITKTAITSFL